MVFNYFRKPSPGYWKQFAKLKLFSNIFHPLVLFRLKIQKKLSNFHKSYQISPSIRVQNFPSIYDYLIRSKVRLHQ